MNRFSSLIISILLGVLPAVAQQTYTMTGTVRDAETKEALSFATIQLNSLKKNNYGAITAADGHYSLIGLPAGTYTATVSYLGYQTYIKEVTLIKNTTLTFYLTSSATSLNEVVITASESKGITSASKIGLTAMKHLQPTSFTDLLELLPGSKASVPAMGAANLIHLREAGSTSEAISSLGVGFVVDGAPVNTDGNLQYVPGTNQFNQARESVSRGVDMRTLSTDNIESVEIVRGIPSVAYGNLTGGVVLINRKQTASPLTARFKADQYSKLFSVGKGFRPTDEHNVLNMDLSYLDSKVDPRNSLENYKRITSSLRWNADRMPGRHKTMNWNLSADYTGSIDDTKTDKDITLKENSYRASYHQFSLAGRWNLKFSDTSFIRALRANVSFSQEINETTETKSVSIDRPMAIPSSTESGEADGIYLPYNYIAKMVIDGKPFYVNSSFAGDFAFRWFQSTHRLRAGLEWAYNKNFGNGQVYDVTRPLTVASTTRPRSYRDIPARQTASFYIEDQVKLSLGKHRLYLEAGLRGNTLLHLSSRFAMKSRLYLDPRLNLQWRMPAFGAQKDWFADLSGGIGWLSKMPTTAQLYPDFKYVDVVQLNYYHNNPDYRRINLNTYKWDNTNYNQEPARNQKWEVRLALSHRGNEFSVTYFQERMNNAFRDISYYRTFQYKKYDVSSIDPSTITAKPDLSDLSYVPDTLINTFTQSGNGTRVRKQGIEFQFASQRIKALKTKITINGAWFRTIYSNSVPKYEESSIFLNGKQLSYIGVYDWEDGTEKQQFNTNVMFDTYLERLGLIFSTSAQCSWFSNSKALWNNGTPIEYIDNTGTVHPFTASSAENAELQHLITNYSAAYFDRKTIPFAMDINLKATKKIGRYINLSLFVNKLLTVYPDYYSGTQLMRRTSSPYFGMEANLTF